MNPLTAVETVATGFSPWRIVAVLVAVAALIGLGAWGGYTMARGYYEPKLSAANEQIGKLTTANTEMKASVEHQNTAIAALQAEAKTREQAATAAVQQAHKLAVKSQTRAQAVLLLKPPTGANECAAAQAAFDDELKDERGTP
jgi:hypothetical protein